MLPIKKINSSRKTFLCYNQKPKKKNNILKTKSNKTLYKAYTNVVLPYFVNKSIYA